MSVSLEKSPAEIAVERDEADLYLSDPELYAALLAQETPSTSIWIGIDPASDDPEKCGVVIGTIEDGRFTPFVDEAIHYTADMANGPLSRVVWRPGISFGPRLIPTLADVASWINANPIQEEPALDPETFPNLPFVETTVTGTITARFDDQRLYDIYAGEPALTLRTVIERLGYDVTEEMDAILADNPGGPWTLEQLETIFAADIDGNHPHGVEFVVQKNQEGALRHPVTAPDGFPGGVSDGDEDTRL